ncbi:cupin domain-containing protein [Erysipelothrix sp. HDW6C]|uniref:helix-turn-helix domain-containing protein n=1 Tax=Erysipelothrix sp. HDW6C TaxID=2714930 RepID=UPI00140B4FA0|nr:XRE family transcriptional regulator [Erysipelothrix sp. HDW6C]QIK69387.1 cupin domain-containing protein [Erysipelothrix sp. HDW6C]
MEIGKKLKELRIKNGLTLEELASRSELTKGFLSQLENDLTSPSIATLNDLVEALGTNLSVFFKQEKKEQIVFKTEDYFVDEREEQTIHWIVPNAQKNEMEPILIELKTGGQSSVIEPHEGEEFGYVLQGKVQLRYGDEEITVSKGQTFYINGSKSHVLVNDFQQTARVIWVCTPPIF